MKKVVRIGLVLAMMALCVANAFAGGSSENAAGAGRTYTVGVCQLVQHNALDAATKGFEDALKDKLGDSVKIVEHNHNQRLRVIQRGPHNGERNSSPSGSSGRNR
mgnify:CR=1 FL=1